MSTSIPDWAVRHSLEGEALEQNREYNSDRKLHGEWIHPDRFRYSHRFLQENRELRSYSCGGKYDPNDTSDCPFCQGFKYNIAFEEILKVAEGTFCYPRKYDINAVVAGWKAMSTTK